MYQFVMPAKAATIRFTFEGLEAFWNGKGAPMIGTTVEITHNLKDSYNVKLYDTVIARIYKDGEVHICEAINDYPRGATTAWVQKVLTDNNIGGMVGRTNGKYAVAGQTYNVR